MSRYDVNAANTNRVVRFIVQPNNSTDRDATLFGMFKGRGSAYPHYGALATVPTANQELSQLRTSLVVRALTAYAPAVGVKLAQDSAATGLTATFGSALVVEFETDESGVFFNQDWTGNTTLAKHLVTDVVDKVGFGGASGAKTKPGLQSLLNSLSTVSYDGGTTGPFGTLSATGNIVLPDGQTTSGAPSLATDVDPELTGLVITYVA